VFRLQAVGRRFAGFEALKQTLQQNGVLDIPQQHGGLHGNNAIVALEQMARHFTG